MSYFGGRYDIFLINMYKMVVKYKIKNSNSNYFVTMLKIKYTPSMWIHVKFLCVLVSWDNFREDNI
jgi:hypothetical protein